jgi:intracellular sulfur oxidation DsrE/DsrF family protein
MMKPLTPAISRRSFVSRAAAGIAALGMATEALEPAHAQLVWKGSQWKLAEFHKLVNDPASLKQVYDVSQISAGKFLNSIKNSLNGLCFGFDVPKENVKIVGALHGPANMINYDDFIWNKYQIGEWLNVTDPSTGKPAVRNIYYAAKHPLDAASWGKDPSDRDSVYQDTSVEALRARGVRFLSCHTATEEQARMLVERNKLTQSPEEIVTEMLAHIMPGVMVVASMVAAIALLQSEGRYTYITVA